KLSSVEVEDLPPLASASPVGHPFAKSRVPCPSQDPHGRQLEVADPSTIPADGSEHAETLTHLLVLNSDKIQRLAFILKKAALYARCNKPLQQFKKGLCLARRSVHFGPATSLTNTMLSFSSISSVAVTHQTSAATPKGGMLLASLNSIINDALSHHHESKLSSKLQAKTSVTTPASSIITVSILHNSSDSLPAARHHSSSIMPSHGVPPLELPFGIQVLNGRQYRCTVCAVGESQMPLSRALAHSMTAAHRRGVERETMARRLQTSSGTPAAAPTPMEIDDFEADMTSGMDSYHEPDHPNPVQPPPLPPLLNRSAHTRTSWFDNPAPMDDNFLPPHDDSQLFEDDLSDLRRLAAAHTEDYSPFPDKVTFVLAFISNIPRRPLSTNQIKSVLLAFELLQVPNVPSFSRYQAVMEDMRASMAVSGPRPFRGLHGHEFWIKPIAGGIRSDFGNPYLRPKMQLYPRRTSHISDYMDSKLAGDDARTRAPMVDLGNKRHAFLKEVVEHQGGLLFVTAWYEGKDGKLWAEGLTAAQERWQFTVDDRTERVPISDIKATGREVSETRTVSHIMFKGQKISLLNPMRKTAKGRAVYNIPIFAFMDDVSGASSKRWNKHHICLVQNAAFDSKTLGLDATLRTFAVSEEASPQEISQALVDEFEQLHRSGTVCWDVEKQEPVLVYAHLAAMICDNPMAAELASNVGLKGNFSCRSCEFGGSQQYRESVDGLAACTHPNTPRTTDSVKGSLQTQMDLAISGLKGAWTKEATRTGTKDKLTSSTCEQLVQEFIARKDEGSALDENIRAEVKVLKDEMEAEGKHWNQFFRLQDLTGFDVTRHLPCEILHTVLLGTVKYLTHATMTALSEQKKDDLATWLSEADMSNISKGKKLRARYLVKHHQSLVGKDLKTLAQTMQWALVQSGADPDLCQAWQAKGALAAALHVPVFERETLEDWKEHVTVLLQHFYQCFAKVKPRMLASKPKLHILSHAIDDMERYGPLSLVSSERFESFNAVFRQASMLSNRKKPSRDIIRRLADEETMRDVLSNSVYWDMTSKTLRRPGVMLQRLLRANKNTHTAAVKMYGLVKKHDSAQGRVPGTFDFKRRSVWLESGDWAKKGDFVLLRDSVCKSIVGDEQTQTKIVQVEDLRLVLQPEADDSAQDAVRALRVVPLWPYDCSGLATSSPNAPNLFRLAGAEEARIVTAKDVIASVTLNHDCAGQGCSIGFNNIVHRGADNVYVLNTCLFRSTWQMKGAYGNRLHHITAGEIGRTAHGAMRGG
ncbi:hypothetical protein A4X13_0g7528, partial [Tilletia indica]